VNDGGVYARVGRDQPCLRVVVLPVIFAVSVI
jgi:hypothetical protein